MKKRLKYIAIGAIVAVITILALPLLIYVPPIQSAYLTENLFDPDTYADDNLEWDLIIYATPAPKTDS